MSKKIILNSVLVCVLLTGAVGSIYIVKQEETKIDKRVQDIVKDYEAKLKTEKDKTKKMEEELNQEREKTMKLDIDIHKGEFIPPLKVDIN